MGTLSREWIFWTTYGVLEPWGTTHGIQVPLTSWRLLDLTGGLLEAWIPLMRIIWILACSQGRVKRADWRLLLWLPGFVRPLLCILQLESSENSSPLYSMLMFHTEAGLPPLERELGYGMQSQPESRRVSMQGRDNHCWSLPKQLTKSSFNIWLRLDYSVPHAHRKSMRSLCATWILYTTGWEVQSTLRNKGDSGTKQLWRWAGKAQISIWRRPTTACTPREDKVPHKVLLPSGARVPAVRLGRVPT